MGMPLACRRAHAAAAEPSRTRHVRPPCDRGQGTAERWLQAGHPAWRPGRLVAWCRIEGGQQHANAFVELVEGLPQRGQISLLASMPLLQLGDLPPPAQDKGDQLRATCPVQIQRGIYVGSLPLLLTSEQIRALANERIWTSSGIVVLFVESH
jgi:hypothetical protein